MDFLNLLNSLKPKLQRLVRIINDETVSPELRRAAHRSALETIGSVVYGKTYDMTAWDLEISETLGLGLDRELAAGLARNLSDSIATGDFSTSNDQLMSYLHGANSAAQFQALSTAKSLGKYAVMTREIRGEKTCQWCIARANRYENPKPEDFRRHTVCDCRIKVEGFNSRNGTLKNYKNS